jgi:regulatory protein YycH of two-component signal transduction system YycFG
MPDVDRSEQQLISKAMSEKGLEFDFGENEDPLSTFSKMSDLFGESGNIFDSDTIASKTEDEKDTESSYFKIFGDDEEEPLQKSKAGQSFLGEFTSMFKGFS